MYQNFRNVLKIIFKKFNKVIFNNNIVKSLNIPMIVKDLNLRIFLDAKLSTSQIKLFLLLPELPSPYCINKVVSKLSPYCINKVVSKLSPYSMYEDVSKLYLSF